MRWSEKANFASILWFFFHSFQLYLGVFLSVVNIPLSKPPSLPLFCLYCAKNCKFFYVLWAICSSPRQISNIIELWFLDLKVLQVSFSVIEENSIVLDSWLHCYSCIWFELVVFSSVESKFSILNRKVSSLSSFCLEKKLVSNVALKNNSYLRLAFFLSFTH